MNEGQRVTYVGESVAGLSHGDAGHLLVFASRDAAHIQMSSGDVFLVALDELTTTGQRTEPDLLADSLEVGGLTTFAVRQVYDEDGSGGVLNAMASLGHLAGFAEIAEEALSLVVSRIRTDPSFREVLSHLDDEEGEAVLRLASACLVRDAFESEE